MNGHYPKPGGLAAALAVLIAVVLAACSPKGAAGGDAEYALHHPFPLFAVRRHAAEVFPDQQMRQFMRDDLIDKGLLVFL